MAKGKWQMYRSRLESRLRILHPSVPRVVSPGAVTALLAGEDPSVVKLVAGRRHERMITFGQKDCITVFHREGRRETIGVIGGGVGPHQSKALGGFDAEKINLLEDSFLRRVRAVVLMGRVAGPVARRVERLARQQALLRNVLGQRRIDG